MASLDTEQQHVFRPAPSLGQRVVDSTAQAHFFDILEADKLNTTNQTVAFGTGYDTIVGTCVLDSPRLAAFEFVLWLD